MGDRVLIQMKLHEDVSPVLYLHCDGSDAPDIIKETAKLMSGRPNDLDYSFARMVGICHVRTPGNLSIGVWNFDRQLEEDDSHGDAGCYLVNIADWSVEAFGGYGESFCAPEEHILPRNVLCLFPPVHA